MSDDVLSLPNAAYRLPVAVRARIALNPMARASVLVQLLLLAATAPLYPLAGVSIAWGTAVPALVLNGIFAGLWAYHVVVPERRATLVPDMLLVLLLLNVLSSICSTAQYPALALKRPLVDAWLAAADARLGLYVPALAAWTRDHAAVSRALNFCYWTLVPQLVLTPVALALAVRDREALWEFFFNFHVCLVVTIAVLIAFPAACAFTYYGFASTLDQAHFLHQFNALRDGTLTRIRFDDLEGFISVPSFHAAGALMVSWAFRRHRRWLAVVLPLNAGLFLATFMSGAHYVIDVILSVLLFAAAAWLYRRRGPFLPAARP
jgi:hypothetical protein